MIARLLSKTLVRSLLLVLGLSSAAGAIQASQREGLVSEIPLAGDLLDAATRMPAEFTRSSDAYTAAGEPVPANQPRFETSAVAVGFDCRIDATPNERVPIAIAAGELFAVDIANRLWVSRDGLQFQPRGTLPGELIGQTSAFVTPQGSLLLGIKHPYQAPLHKLWRSQDRGYTFEAVLEFPLGGWPARWNYTCLENLLFVSEYGTRQGASQHIYVSQDDGRTWELAFCPSEPIIGFHFHKLLGDPWSGRIYQTFGDDPWLGMLYSRDGGNSWSDFDDFHLSTSGIARPEAVYWGSDGWGRGRVARYDREQDRWTHPLRPWFGYTSSHGQTPTCNVYAMLEHAGVMYAPFAAKGNEIWASRDGLHWAFCWAGDLASKGVYSLQGELGGWIHGLYDFDDTHAPFPHSYGHLRFRPGRVASLLGLRIDPPAVNLVGSPDGSSVEQGLDGWDRSLSSDLLWDTSKSFHGNASAMVTNTNLADCQVRCPPASEPLPTGTKVHAQIRMTGGAQVLSVRLVDEQNDHWGPHTLASPDVQWTAVNSELTVAHPDNRIRLVVGGWSERAESTMVWLDGYQITARQTGSTWQLGGTPRAGESLRARVEFPAQWTDFVYYQPDFSSAFASGSPMTIKAWVQDVDNYAKLAFDPLDHRFKLIEVLDARPVTVSATDAVTLQPGWTCRIGLRSSKESSEFRVYVGSTLVYGIGAPISVRPTDLWIGSSPAGDDQAPGVYLLSRTFDSALEDAAFDQELSFLPLPSADVNRDGDVDIKDFGVMFGCLAGPRDPLGITCWTADISPNGRVDLRDFAALQSAFTR